MDFEKDASYNLASFPIGLQLKRSLCEVFTSSGALGDVSTYFRKNLVVLVNKYFYYRNNMNLACYYNL